MNLPIPNVALREQPPLIVHIIFRLDVGGLENGLVNLLNNLPPSEFRHAIICITDYTSFRDRLNRSDVEVYSLRKPPGNSLRTHAKVWKLLRELSPTIVHTRNLAALEFQIAAALAGVPVRIHGEHGWDMRDLDGRNRRYLAMKRFVRPFVHHYIGLSRHIERYLRESVRIPAHDVSQIYNGVDTDRFRPAANGRTRLPDPMFDGEDLIVIGTVGRMERVKDPLTLARAFVRLTQTVPEMRHRLRLVMVGDGTVKREVVACIEQAGLLGQVWLPGSLNNVHEILRGLDVFVLPSLAEGISNTILEAMATGLPVLATRTGGNPELVDDGETGSLVPPADPDALADGMLTYVRQAAVRLQHGRRARQVAVERFSLAAMVDQYASLYRRFAPARSSTARNDSSSSSVDPRKHVEPINHSH